MVEQNLSDEMVRVLDVQDSLTLKENDEQKYVFPGFEAFMASVDEAIEKVSQSTFESEEDRKALGKAKAFSNKLVVFAKRQVKEAQAEAFAPANEQVKLMEAKMGELSRGLKSAQDEFERRYREEKSGRARSEFDSRLRFHPELEQVVSFEQIFDARWMNRSVTDKKMLAELDSRFSMIGAMDQIADSKGQAVTYLVSQEWDLASAMTRLNQDRVDAADAARRAEEAERQARIVAEHDAREKAERTARESEESDAGSVDGRGEAVQEPDQVFTVQVSASEVPRFLELADRRGWSVERVNEA